MTDDFLCRLANQRLRAAPQAESNSCVEAAVLPR